MNSTPRASKNRNFKITENNSLLKFLFEALKNESKTTVKSLLAHKQVFINGRGVTQFDAPLKPGDEVGIYFDRHSTPFSHPQLKILFEDDSVIVVEKASGLLSMSTGKDRKKTAYRLLSDYVKKNAPHNHIFILHRLDRDTSGIMMFAKKRQVQEILQQNWENMVLERKYVAVVEGELKQDSGTLKSYIAENSAFIVHAATADEGKLAITHFRAVKTNHFYTLVELELETGRKNQIRVHMQEYGYPVAGDKKYGAKTNPIRRLALHAFKLRFIHPVSHQEMDFETPFPGRFQALVK